MKATIIDRGSDYMPFVGGRFIIADEKGRHRWYWSEAGAFRKAGDKGTTTEDFQYLVSGVNQIIPILKEEGFE